MLKNMQNWKSHCLRYPSSGKSARCCTASTISSPFISVRLCQGGVIPSAWEQRKLGDITNSYSGGTPQANNSAYYNGSIPFIRSAEINADKTELFLSERGLAESSAAMVDAGCILYALYGATSGEVGISRIDGAINQAILAIYPYEGFDASFLASWLRREKDEIVATYLQGGQGNLSGAIVKNLEVAVPSMPEQKAIGSCLTSLDNLITLHQRYAKRHSNCTDTV